MNIPGNCDTYQTIEQFNQRQYHGGYNQALFLSGDTRSFHVDAVRGSPYAHHERLPREDGSYYSNSFINTQSRDDMYQRHLVNPPCDYRRSLQCWNCGEIGHIRGQCRNHQTLFERNVTGRPRSTNNNYNYSHNEGCWWFNKVLRIQAKRLYIDMQQNIQGNIVNITVVTSRGRRDRLVLPMTIVEEFRDQITDLVNHYAGLGPSPYNDMRSRRLKSLMLVKEDRKYFLDLLENQRGRFLRVAQLKHTEQRRQIAIPAQGIIDFRDAISELLAECECSDRNHGPVQLISCSTQTIAVEHDTQTEQVRELEHVRHHDEQIAADCIPNTGAEGSVSSTTNEACSRIHNVCSIDVNDNSPLVSERPITETGKKASVRKQKSALVFTENKKSVSRKKRNSQDSVTGRGDGQEKNNGSKQTCEQNTENNNVFERKDEGSSVNVYKEASRNDDKVENDDGPDGIVYYSTAEFMLPSRKISCDWFFGEPDPETKREYERICRSDTRANRRL